MIPDPEMDIRRKKLAGLPVHSMSHPVITED